MSWKSSGLSVIQKSLNVRIFETLKLKNVMSTWQTCETKSRQQATECCSMKSLMDEAPEPCGSWQQNFARKNIQDTRMLFIGVTSFVITLLYLKKNGLAKDHPEISLW